MLSSPQRPNSQTKRSRRTFSGDIEDYDSDVKAYRYLLAVFADNVNSTIKNNRDCLGDMELIPKIKLSREEQQYFSEQLEKIYHRTQQRLSRQMINRNSNIRRNYEDYVYEYRACYPESDCKDENGSTSLERSFMATPQVNKGNNVSGVSGQRRPQTSKSMNYKNTMATIDQAFEGFNSTVAKIFKMKTIIPNYGQNPERRDKRLTVNQHRKLLRQELILSRNRKNFFSEVVPTEKRYNKAQKDQQSNNFIFSGNQIMICQHRPTTGEQRTGQVSKDRNGSQKRSITLRMAQRKSIDEIERMQIQNRLTLINSTFSLNQAKPQGYKPKSRCWQNYFN